MCKLLKLSLMCLLLMNISANTFASCENVIRLHILKKFKLDKDIRLFKRADKKLFTRRQKELKSSLLTLGSRRKQIGSNRSLSFQRLKSFLRSKLFDRKFRKAIKVFTHSIYDPKLVSEWADNLYRDIVLETYVDANLERVESFNQDLSLSRELAIEVLAHRSIEGGFDGKVEIIDFLFTENEIKQLFKMKRIFIETNYENKNHGSITHMLHIDFLIFAMKKAKIDPLRVSEIFEWIGNSKSWIYLPKTEDDFKPVYDVWSTNFSSYESGISNPDVFNAITSRYFKFE